MEKEPATGHQIPTYRRPSGAPLSLASLHQLVNYSSPTILNGVCVSASGKEVLMFLLLQEAILRF